VEPSFWNIPLIGICHPIRGGSRSSAAARTLRTPEVVEFAMSPRVGQAVPSLDPIRAVGLIQRGRAGGTACPTCEALAIERNGSAHFPRQGRNCGVTSGVLTVSAYAGASAAGSTHSPPVKRQSGPATPRPRRRR
jgi:hypothetical protein